MFDTLSQFFNKPERHTQTDVLYGPLGKDKYPVDAQRAVEKKFGEYADENTKKERQKYWANYDEVVKIARRPELKTVDQVREAVIKYFRQQNTFADTIFANADDPDSERDPEKEPDLAEHLRDISAFAQKFLYKPDGSLRFSEKVLNKRQVALMTQVIPQWHDLLKLLTTPEFQIAPDHEAVTGHLFRQTMQGKTFILDGVKTELSDDDIAFIAGVIEDHENMGKSDTRTHFVDSKDPVEKGKAIFFMMDVLTGCFTEEGLQEGKLIIDTQQLEKRFTNLYVRHLDPIEGKTYEPDWGLRTIQDLFHTLDTLEKQGDLNLHHNTKALILSEARHAIFIVEQAQILKVAYNNTFRNVNNGSEEMQKNRQKFAEKISENPHLKKTTELIHKNPNTRLPVLRKDQMTEVSNIGYQIDELIGT